MKRPADRDVNMDKLDIDQKSESLDQNSPSHPKMNIDLEIRNIDARIRYLRRYYMPGVSQPRILFRFCVDPSLFEAFLRLGRNLYEFGDDFSRETENLYCEFFRQISDTSAKIMENIGVLPGPHELMARLVCLLVEMASVTTKHSNQKVILLHQV